MESLIFLLVMNFMVILTVKLDIAFQFKPFGVLLSIVSVRRFFSETTMSTENKMPSSLSLGPILNFCQAIARKEYVMCDPTDKVHLNKL